MFHKTISRGAYSGIQSYSSVALQRQSSYARFYHSYPCIKVMFNKTILRGAYCVMLLLFLSLHKFHV